MAKRGMPRIPICENWLIYWGYCRKFPKQTLGDMVFVSRKTIDTRFREMGLQYKPCRMLKSYDDRKVRKKYYVPKTKKPPKNKKPPWELNSHISNFLAQLEEGTSKTDVGSFMKQYREGVRNGRL